ncbi:hypothetical protein BOTBODRAFT_231874 [Botryobasidium botryosum FD-172 SS1]|uniref:Uncharacterized protein n=1 Tax=Botryobasidium botryosum (strain FD-172 SS1) TaxID=930990 RepID=A0A067M530_BOTB1|nr:hypothetical protein BOTBODRAFT_231874 [Botryobasidium botryosum FD-172 SS1]
MKVEEKHKNASAHSYSASSGSLIRVALSNSSASGRPRRGILVGHVSKHLAFKDRSLASSVSPSQKAGLTTCQKAALPSNHGCPHARASASQAYTSDETMPLSTTLSSQPSVRENLTEISVKRTRSTKLSSKSIKLAAAWRVRMRLPTVDRKDESNAVIL